MHPLTLLSVFAASAAPLAGAVTSQAYTWKNVKIGGGGGFIPGIVFNPSQKGLAYARTDIGGAYRLNSDDTWTPLLDFADNARWNYWGVDALATDPVDPTRLYLVCLALCKRCASVSDEVRFVGDGNVHQLMGSK